MSGFTFGAQGTSTTPATGGLFGAAPKPLFGTSPATVQSGGAGLFGSSISAPAASTAPAGSIGSTVPSGGLFGTPAKTTTVTGGLIGTAGVATTSSVCGPFGSASVTTTPTLFGGAPATTVTGSLFGKPTTGLFSSPAPVTTALTGGLFGTSGTPTTTTGVGLGGTGTLAATGFTSSSLGVAGAAASGNPLEAEVQQVVMDLFNLLRDQIKKNHELSVEFAMNSSESCLHMDEKIEELVGTRVKNVDIVRRAKGRAEELLEKMQRDLRAAEQVRRRQKEISKNPHFGRKQAFSYLLAVCIEHENTVQEFWETLQVLQERIDAKLNKKDITTKQDLQKHFEHYDQTFKLICSDVYRCKMQIEDLKDAFLEYQKRNVPYAPNPFERRKSKHTEKPIGEKRFTGADAFPSQITMMKIGEMAKPSSTTQQTTAAVSGFGTPGSLFGSKTFGSPAFSFNPSVTNTTTPLFKPFSSTNSAPAPLFGTLATSIAEPAPAPATTTSFTFGNTLNSSVSGTLFGGSASKPFGR
ncbi:Conserved hypothetical protein, putative [Brugia malayi]|uniref:BMA-NPP-4, isoform b n=1 Tax=Brugia malayi TaxID=6279 RepID=A0A4E9FFC9_BRUMA|nr:Conserved hypothetical protein, putative [Brugia malayi]VIO95675.1 Conserved hypothetical protein, putative [Brugia malayi]